MEMKTFGVTKNESSTAKAREILEVLSSVSTAGHYWGFPMMKEGTINSLYLLKFRSYTELPFQVTSGLFSSEIVPKISLPDTDLTLKTREVLDPSKLIDAELEEYYDLLTNNYDQLIQGKKLESMASQLYSSTQAYILSRAFNSKGHFVMLPDIMNSTPSLHIIKTDSCFKSREIKLEVIALSQNKIFYSTRISFSDQIRDLLQNTYPFKPFEMSNIYDMLPDKILKGIQNTRGSWCRYY